MANVACACARGQILGRKKDHHVWQGGKGRYGYDRRRGGGKKKGKQSKDDEI